MLGLCYSGSTPTSSVPVQATELEMEAGLRPTLGRTASARSGRSYRSYPFPGTFDCRPSEMLSTIPSADSAASTAVSGGGLSGGGALTTPPEAHTAPGRTEHLQLQVEPVGGNHHAYQKSNHAHSQSTFTNTSTSAESSANHDADYQKTVFDYRVLSASMHAYRHIAIFRRFGRLSMTNILGYQQELQQLEETLHDLDREEARHHLHASISETPAGPGSCNNNSGVGSMTEETLKENRMKVMRSLRETLKCYYEALLLQDQIFTALDPPRPRDASLLLEVGGAPHHPHSISPFDDAEHRDDLVALGLGGRDSLEKAIGRIVPALFPHRNPSVEDVWSRGMSNKDVASIFSPFTRRITRLTIAFLTTAAMLLPMCILTVVGEGRKSMKLKLGLVSVFTVVLAVGVALATRGRGETIVMVSCYFSGSTCLAFAVPKLTGL